jgi:hypothetical protein
MDRNKSKIIIAAATAFFLIVAVVVLVLSLVINMTLLLKLILIGISIVCFALFGEGVFFIYMVSDKTKNFFLYDSRTRRNISVQKLTFQTINSKMNQFLSKYASSEGKIWNERVLDNPYLEMEDKYKPLVAYKLIFGLADRDSEAGWTCLKNASEETVLFICNGLQANGDNDFAAAFSQRMSDKPVNMTSVRELMVKNKKYIQNKMTKYVLENIDSFN